MSIYQLTDKEIDQLNGVFGSFSLKILQEYLHAHTCVIREVKSEAEFEQRAKILAYLCYRTGSENSSN